jgi:arginine exporter protein ArgO
VLTCLVITWLNPHVYLDTVFLMVRDLDAVSGASFAAGAMTGSFVFFFNARLRGQTAEADIRQTVRLAYARSDHSLGHVVDLVPARRQGLTR